MLPIVKHPTFTYTQSGTEKTVSFRPIVNADFKSIITVIELGEKTDIYSTTLEVVKSCTGGSIDENSANHHIEECFVKLYCKSVENKTDAVYTCDNAVERTITTFEDELDTNGQQVVKSVTNKTEPCGTQQNIKIPIDNAVVVYPQEYLDNKRIHVADSIYINMKSPSAKFILEAMKLIDNAVDGDGEALDQSTAYNSVESVEVGGVITPIADVSQAEFSAWCDTLPVAATVKMSEFIKNPPYIELKMDIVCPSCGNKTSQHMKGLSSFFMF